jgi:hypothetical protein
MKIDVEKEFVLYSEALELKALGFDEPCFGYYSTNLLANEVKLFIDDRKGFSSFEKTTPAPTFSQAFRWFREKYVLFHSIVYLDDNSGEGEFSFEILNKKGNQQQNGEYFEYNSYEEAELTCLRKLIEIVKTK